MPVVVVGVIVAVVVVGVIVAVVVVPLLLTMRMRMIGSN